MRQIVAGDHIGVSAIGAILPYPFGHVRGLPGYPLLVGAQAALREAVTPTSTIFKLDDVASLQRFPDAGSGTLEGEAFAWTARDLTGIALTGIIRHTLGTVAVAHGVGVAVSESVDEARYVFYENPGPFGASSIDAIYFNGLLKAPDVAPSHVVTAVDTNAMHDAITLAAVSVGTVRVDLTDPVSATSPFVQPQSLAALQTWQQARDALSTQWWNFTTSNPVGWQGEGETGQSQTAFNIQNSWALLGRAPKLLPQLGTVTADVTGLLDDAGGTITGTPGLLIRNPAYCARLILQEAFRQTAFDDGSFTEAAAFADARGYAWDFVYLPTTLSEFQAFVFNQSWINVFREGGVWTARFRQRGTSAMTLARDRRVSWAMSYSPQSEIITDVSATYGVGETAQVVTAHSARGAMLRVSNPLPITYPWVLDSGVALALANARLLLGDHQRRSATALMHSTVLPLQRVDTVTVEEPSLVPYGELAWKVKALRWTPDLLIETQLEEEDEPEPMRSRPGFGGTTTVSGTLTIEARLAATITGTAAVVGALTTSVPLAATITGTATVAGVLSTSEQLAATITGTAAMVGVLSTSIQFAASVTGTGTAIADLTGGISGDTGSDGLLLDG